MTHVATEKPATSSSISERVKNTLGNRAKRVTIER